jgi:hypothetical protein
MAIEKQHPGLALDELRTNQKKQPDLNRVTAEHVMDARNRGATWQQIGAALRVTRQAAHERYADLEHGRPGLGVTPATPEPAAVCDTTRRHPT